MNRLQPFLPTLDWLAKPNGKTFHGPTVVTRPGKRPGKEGIGGAA